jgi:hypothetical protein
MGGINIQPLWGWFVVLRIFMSTVFTGGYFCSTPAGLEKDDYHSLPPISSVAINIKPLRGLIIILHNVKHGCTTPCTCNKLINYISNINLP